MADGVCDRENDYWFIAAGCSDQWQTTLHCWTRFSSLLELTWTVIFSCWILIRGVFVSDREPTSSWQTTAMLNSVRGTRKASAITFCFKRLNLNGLIYWLCLSPVAPSYNNLFLLSLTFYLFLPNHIPSLSPFILSPFSTLPTLFISFFPFFSPLPFLSVADFGVSAQITATLAKRKSFIGTPYWLVVLVFLHQLLWHYMWICMQTYEIQKRPSISCEKCVNSKYSLTSGSLKEFV